MTIWDDLYKDLVKSELRHDGSATQDSNFKTVEAKVEDLRQRVGLDSIKNMTKEAALRKSASADPVPEYETALAAMKSYIAGLVDLRRAGISMLAVMNDLKDKFPEHLEIIRDNSTDLEEFVKKQLDKYKVDTPAPIPTLFNKPDGGKDGEDNKIFENIADKLKN